MGILLNVRHRASCRGVGAAGYNRDGGIAREENDSLSAEEVLLFGGQPALFSLHLSLRRFILDNLGPCEVRAHRTMVFPRAAALRLGIPARRQGAGGAHAAAADAQLLF